MTTGVLQWIWGKFANSFFSAGAFTNDWWTRGYLILYRFEKAIEWVIGSNDNGKKTRTDIFILWLTAVIESADHGVVVKGIPLFENEKLEKLDYIG